MKTEDNRIIESIDGEQTQKMSEFYRKAGEHDSIPQFLFSIYGLKFVSQHFHGSLLKSLPNFSVPQLFQCMAQNIMVPKEIENSSDSKSNLF